MSDAKPDTIANLLIAEDDDSMRRFLEVTLKKENYDVSVAKDGAEALEKVLGSHFDAIITDAIMPNLSGYDLCRILRQNSEKRHIPVIILSGFNQDNEATTDNGLADYYLMKEHTLKEDLTTILEKLLKK